MFMIVYGRISEAFCISWEEEDALHANDSTLSSSNADMLAIRDRYKKHHRDVRRAHAQLLSPDPLVEEYPETDDYFIEQDRLNQKGSTSRLERTLCQRP